MPRSRNNCRVTCPLCGKRKARRACPALGHDICAVCCGTKRLTEIRCPSGCVYLASAREHPPATAVKQHQHDVALLVRFLRDLSERQSRLFLLVCAFLTRYEPPELHQLLDVDIAEAAEALAATFETAARGVIYEHRPTSAAASRLGDALAGVLAEAGQDSGANLDRDAAVVLRRIQESVSDAAPPAGQNARAFVDLLARTIRKAGDSPSGVESGSSRLIIP